MNTGNLRVLCLDIEGGYGGSSRSLYESVAHLSRNDAEVTVWCKRAGPIQNIAAKDFRTKLQDAANKVDVVHFNHEALFILARWLKRRTKAKLSMHIRTNLYGTPFCRWQTKSIIDTLDHLVFITENERQSMNDYSGLDAGGTVIFNIVQPTKAPPHNKVPDDGRFKVACLSNYAWVRGLDLVIDLAKVLRANNRRDIQFVMAGNMRLPRSLPGELGKVAASGGTLEDYASKNGVSDWFLFLGHVPDPERVLAACDALIKPTREANPWGRDIQEGLAAAKPVISIGSYDKFVEDRVTGVMPKSFDADEIADRICELADDRSLAKRLGAAGQKRILHLCDGPSRANDLLEVWRKMVKQ